MAKRISVINFKGGVGKTTFAFNFAAGLVRYHDDARVLLVDMDHQSSLSIVALGARAWQESVDNDQTVEQIFRTFTGGRQSFPGIELITHNPLKRHLYRSMSLVPSALALDNTEIELTYSAQGDPIESEWAKRTLICRWLDETGIDDEFDYVIFDCPPATKLVAQNAIAASHGYVIPVVPEAVMERGAPHLEELIDSGIDARIKRLAINGTPRSTYVPTTKLLGLVITRIQRAGGYSGFTDDHTEHLNSLTRRWKGQLMKPYVLQGTEVSKALGQSQPVYDFPRSQGIGKRGIDRQYRNLTTELKQRIDAL